MKEKVKKTVKAPVRARRPGSRPVKVAKNPPGPKALRSFWGLFANAKNHKFDQAMSPGNYLDEFIDTIENLPQAAFDEILADDTSLRKYRLDRYQSEVNYLKSLIDFSNKSAARKPSMSTEQLVKRALGSAFEEFRQTHSTRDGAYALSEEELREVVAPVETSTGDLSIKNTRDEMRTRLGKIANMIKSGDTKGSLDSVLAELKLPKAPSPERDLPKAFVTETETETETETQEEMTPPAPVEPQGAVKEVQEAKGRLESFENIFVGIQVGLIAAQHKAGIQLKAFESDLDEEALRKALTAELKAKHLYMMAEKIRKALYIQFDAAEIDQADVAVFTSVGSSSSLKEMFEEKFKSFGLSDEEVEVINRYHCKKPKLDGRVGIVRSYS